jgi:hypothetical protein
MMEDECAICGRKIDMSKGAYGLGLIEIRPKDDKLFPGEEVLWTSSPYCSKKCLENALNQIRSELMAWLQEENWALKIMRRR